MLLVSGQLEGLLVHNGKSLAFIALAYSQRRPNFNGLIISNPCVALHDQSQLPA